MKVLELGNYIIPAYAGMILAEQGADVEKWTNGNDPIIPLKQGDELWEWINTGKKVLDIDAREVLHISPGEFDVIIDNFRPATLEKFGIDPDALAKELNVIWISMRSEVDDTSFDMLAQMRSWAEYGVYAPFYVGDTTGGLWLAFKALAMYAEKKTGHYLLGQASCMQKLVEGELVVTPAQRYKSAAPWNINPYCYDAENKLGIVAYKRKTYIEPVRDHQWKLDHLWHDNGRIRI